MRIDVFTEGSGTLRENPRDTVNEYFGGGFTSVRTLTEELSKHGNTTLHVLSDELGYVTGTDPIPKENTGEELGLEEYELEKRSFREQMQESASEADLIVLLFTKDAFRVLVSTQWNDLSSASRKDSIWCVATSNTAFNTIDLSQLNGTVIQHQRVSVARIGTETREELVSTIQERATSSADGQ